MRHRRGRAFREPRQADAIRLIAALVCDPAPHAYAGAGAGHRSAINANAGTAHHRSAADTDAGTAGQRSDTAASTGTHAGAAANAGTAANARSAAHRQPDPTGQRW
jgi:hypothetical protein